MGTDGKQSLARRDQPENVVEIFYPSIREVMVISYKAWIEQAVNFVVRRNYGDRSPRSWLMRKRCYWIRTSSTRRFLKRSSSVALPAAGWDSPYPLADRRSAAMPLLTRYVRTASARCWD